MNERLRCLRKKLKLNQAEMGKILGITTSGVSDIESGRRNVTEKHIKLLCIEPINGKCINEEWLRSGEGDMFKQLPEEDKIAITVSNLLEDGDKNPMYEIIIEIMRTYDELSPKSQEAMCEASRKLLENLRKRKGS